MGGGSGGLLNSSFIPDSSYNVSALAFIGVSEPWHKTEIRGGGGGSRTKWKKKMTGLKIKEGK
jgi:hypothetical protein